MSTRSWAGEDHCRSAPQRCPADLLGQPTRGSNGDVASGRTSAGGARRRGVAEQVDPDRHAADGGRLAAEEHPVRTGLACDHEVVAGVLEPPADLLDLAEGLGRTRRDMLPLGAAEPGASGATADLELDLEEELASFLRSYGCADWRRQE